MTVGRRGRGWVKTPKQAQVGGVAIRREVDGSQTRYEVLAYDTNGPGTITQLREID